MNTFFAGVIVGAVIGMAVVGTYYHRAWTAESRRMQRWARRLSGLVTSLHTGVDSDD